MYMMEEPNKVHRREELFQKVWETDYTGDTRTLDVHISWLRQALEDNPRQPEYILTERRVGYQLRIPETSPDPEG
jgi:DNA-binding response OmpR family regulator